MAAATSPSDPVNLNNMIGSIIISLRWKMCLQMAAVFDFAFKKIFLVQKKNDGSFDKPFVVANRVKQLHRFHHTIHLFVFRQNQIITAESNTKNNCCHSFKTVDPFFSLGSLATNVKHFEM